MSDEIQPIAVQAVTKDGRVWIAPLGTTTRPPSVEWNRVDARNDDDVLLASALRKLLTNSGKHGAWFYDYDPDDPDQPDYAPHALGVDASAELTDDEGRAVQRAMKGQA